MKMIPRGKQIFSRVVNLMKDLSLDRTKNHTHNARKSTRNNAMTYDVVIPQEVTKENSFPSNIITPPKYFYGEFDEVPMHPIIKTKDEIELMRSSCRLAKKMLNAARKQIRVGMTTDELDKYIHNLTIKNGAYPSPLRYEGFPKSICTSVNNVVCHGIPDSRPLANGDIISVDVSVYHQGFHGDCAATFLVGDVDEEGQYLVNRAERILLKAIKACKPGKDFSAIGNTISILAKKTKLTVIPCVHGHGIGKYFHEFPVIEHFNAAYLEDHEMIEEVFPSGNTEMQKYELSDDAEEPMLPGMTFTIEPVFGTGTLNTELCEDGWTVITEDDSRTAQFEHTILITDTGAEILTA